MSSATWFRLLGLSFVLAVGLLVAPAWTQAPAGKKVALLVGVRQYKRDIQFPDLQYTENDVVKLAEILRSPAAGFSTVRLLTTTRGEKNAADAPTAANIRKELETLLEDRGPRDTVLIALTGHGVALDVEDPDGKGKNRSYSFFCPSDADLVGVSYSTGRSKWLLNLEELFGGLGRCGAGVKLVLMDACRSELKLKKESSTRSLNAESVTIPTGVGALFSCSAGQYAYEAKKLEHGVFFHFVLEGLETVTFAAGQATQTVQMTTIDNNNLNPNLDFKLIATPVGGTSIMRLATIVNDDAAISVSNDSATEGGTSIRSLGAFVPAGVGGLTDAYAMIDGADGNVYVSTLSGSAVYRYDAAGNPRPAPGQSGATFVAPGSGGLSMARDISFGPDGYLYVVSQGTNAVLRYDPVSGAPAGTLVASGAGGLDAPRGLLFQNGYVYVTSCGATGTGPGASSVLRFDAVTGAPAGVSGVPGDAVFIASGSGGLANPSRIVFGPDGNAYVAGTASSSNAVLRYDGTTGAFIDAFVPSGSGGLDGPIAMVFRPDGYLYVVGWRSNSVLRYQASNGAFVGTVVPSGSGGVSSPIDLLFDANGNLLVTSRNTDQVLHYGATSQFAFTVSLASASAGTTTVNYATADGTALAGTNYIAVSGTLTFPPGLTSQTVVVQTLDDGHADPTKAFTINLSNATGGVITSAQGVGTILDDTQFYVVDGGSSDSSYQYATSGGALGNNALTSGDTAPRGVATTAAGTTEWVVDANKTVYVYSTGGARLGSWSAGGLSSSATLTGIATNGTDIWLVDSSTDKVYEYAGAASRLSGSQSAASSFSLVSGKKGNTNPQDIVTDGTSFWVVDGTALKVFKYTPSGSSLGNWSIDPANAHPTGIAIDPTNVSNIWIVDNGTDKVYQYTAAASRTSGSQNAAATFAVAAGDTNPQGIADPPPAGTFLTTAPSPALRGLPSVTAFHPASSVSPSIVAVDPMLANRDALFTLLERETLLKATQPTIDLTASAALTSGRESPIPVTASTLISTGVSGGQKAMGNITSLAQAGNHGSGSGRNTTGLLDGAWAEEERQAADLLFAGMA